MPSLFNAQDNYEMLLRVEKLTPSHSAKWGTMNVNQMLEHCTVPLLTAFGDKKLKKTFIGFLFGKMARKKILAENVAFKKNLPTDKHFKIQHTPQFETAKQKLTELIKRFLTVGPQGITQDPHPFFGKMTAHEWDVLQWKHLHHHLTQFGE